MRAKEKQDDFNFKLMQSLDITERKWIRRQSQVGQEVTNLMMRKEEKQEMLVGNDLNLQSILSGKHAVAQVHLLSESIGEGLGWTSYMGK
jgi:hypothetical protein